MCHFTFLTVHTTTKKPAKPFRNNTVIRDFIKQQKHYEKPNSESNFAIFGIECAIFIYFLLYFALQCCNSW